MSYIGLTNSHATLCRPFAPRSWAIAHHSFLLPVSGSAIDNGASADMALHHPVAALLPLNSDSLDQR
jgi:hypothetical protein